MSIASVVTRGFVGTGSVVFVPTRGYGATYTSPVPTLFAPSLAERIFPEQSSGAYFRYLRDENGVVVPRASLTTLTLTLYDAATGTVIRSNQNANGANNVDVHATSGLMSWAIQTGDTTLVNTSLAAGEVEEHRFMLTWTYASGAKTGRIEDFFLVRAMEKV